MSDIIRVIREVDGKSTFTSTSINLEALAQYMGWNTYKFVTVGEEYWGIQLIEGVKMRADNANKRIRKLPGGSSYYFYNDLDDQLHTSGGNLYIGHGEFSNQTQQLIYQWQDDHDPIKIAASNIVNKLKNGETLTDAESIIVGMCRDMFPHLLEKLTD